MDSMAVEIGDLESIQDVIVNNTVKLMLKVKL